MLGPFDLRSGQAVARWMLALLLRSVFRSLSSDYRVSANTLSTIFPRV
jgi:hypothetical protein